MPCPSSLQTSGRARREGQALTSGEFRALTRACQGRYRDIVPVLALAGLRWGELAGLLRHTAASVWLGARADPKVVQRVLGHATAAMTMDLYGHLVDDNLWEAARAVGAS